MPSRRPSVGQRIDLWYGAHYLRFTQTETTHGRVLLRLEERARLATADAAGPTLLTQEQLPVALPLRGDSLAAPVHSEEPEPGGVRTSRK